MSSFLDWSFWKSHRFQLVAVAFVSTSITAAAIFGGQSIIREARVQKLKDSVPNSEEHTVPYLEDYLQSTTKKLTVVVD
jgi:hypothetical protein